MTVKFYRGEPHEYTQENAAFYYLCSDSKEYLSDKGDVRIIGNVRCNRRPFDAIVISPRSISVVDFKNYGGRLSITEDKEWHTDDGIQVKGGRYLNPFHQIRDYKIQLARWITANMPSDQIDASYISCLVLFTKPIQINSDQIDERSRSWFFASDYPDGINFLRNIASPKIKVSSPYMDEMVERLRVREVPVRHVTDFVSHQIERVRSDAAHDMAQQIEDERNSKWWAEHRERLRDEYEEATRQWFMIDSKSRT
jgi:hypothetical protein